MKIQKLFLTVLLLMVMALAVLTCITKSDEWSKYEKRALAGKPNFQLSALVSGKTQTQLEAYLNDRVYARERMLRLRARLLTALGKPMVNDVVVTEKALLPKPLGNELTDLQRQNAEKIAEGFARVQAQTQQFGGRFLYVLVPEQRSALRSTYPDSLQVDGAYLDACADVLLDQMEQHGVCCLDLRGVLSEQDYYKTDHHYSLTGAYTVYRAICAEFSLEPVAITVQKTNCDLTGTYACKLFGTNSVRDRYETYVPSVAFTREDNAAPSDKPLFAAADGAVMYDAYMGLYERAGNGLLSVVS